MLIRAMLPDDVEPCAAFMAATPLFQQYGVTLDRAIARLSGALSMALVAVNDEGKPVGFVLYVMNGAFNRSGYIPLLAVDSEHRGGSIGRLLLDRAEQILKPASADVFLLCSDFNVEAQRFYQRQGYTQVGAIPDYVLPGVAELIFRKHMGA